MMNPFKEVNWKPDNAEKRKFAVSLMIGFPVLAVVMLLLRRITSGAWPWHTAAWLGGMGLGFGILFWLVPYIAQPFYMAWYFLACCMGLVIGNALLLGFYFTVVLGIGLFLRLTGRARVQKGFARGAGTYWLDNEPASDPSRYFRQF